MLTPPVASVARVRHKQLRDISDEAPGHGAVDEVRTEVRRLGERLWTGETSKQVRASWRSEGRQRRRGAEGCLENAASNPSLNTVSQIPTSQGLAQ